MQPGTRAPGLDQGRSVEGLLAVEARAEAEVVLLQVRVERRGMARGAAGLLEDLPSASDGRVVAAPSTGRLHGAQVRVDRQGVLLRSHGELDVADPGAHRDLGRVARAGAHGRRRAVGEQQALGVLGVADAVVQEVPVQPVHAPVGVAAGAALPLLEAQRGVVEEHLAAAREAGRDLGRSQGDRARRAIGLRIEVDHPQAVREVLGREGAPGHDRQAARAPAGRRDPAPQAGEEGQVVGDLRGHRLLHPQEDLQHAGQVDDGELVAPGVGHQQPGALRVHRHAPGVGGAAVDVVEQDGVQELAPLDVDDAQRVGVHPAALELGRRQVVAGEDVRREGVLAVRGDAQVAQAGAPVGQADPRRDPPLGGGDRGDLGRDVVAVGGSDRQQVGHEEQLAVGGQRPRHRLAGRADPRPLAPVGRVHGAHRVIEAIADPERATVRADLRRAGRGSDSVLRDQLAARGIQHQHPSDRLPAGGVEPLPLGGEGQAAGRSRQGQDSRDLGGPGIHDDDPGRRGAGQVEMLAARVDDRLQGREHLRAGGAPADRRAEAREEGGQAGDRATVRPPRSRTS